MEQRLQKLLAAAGVASRREAEELIKAGRVAVDGRVITELWTKVDPEQVTVAVDGRPVSMYPEKVYVLLNKPRGYTSTTHDPHAKRVVTDLVKDVGVSLYPVGRLDVDTEGLLILTNDGDFTHKMTHPSHQIPKTYRADVRGLVAEETAHHLATGVVLDDGITAPAKVRLLGVNTARETSVIELTIHEGRKRQIRRMLDTVGHPVIRLTRTKIGGLTVGNLRPGEWRFLRPGEVGELLGLAGSNE